MRRVARSVAIRTQQEREATCVVFGNEDGRPQSAEDAPFYKLQAISAVPPKERNIWSDLNLPFSLIDGKFSVSAPINISTNRFFRVVGRL